MIGAGRVLFLLKRACDRALPLVLHMPADAITWHGHFRALQRSSLVVAARRVAGLAPPVPATQLVLSFNEGAATAIALCTLLRFTPGRGRDARDRFVLALPAQVATERGRQNYRAPVGAPDAEVADVAIDGGDGDVGELRASLCVREGRLVPAVVRDVSVTGIAVDLVRADDARFRIHDQTSIALALGEHAVVLEAVVRRMDGPRLALCFHEIERADQAPEALRRIVSCMETRFLRARKADRRPADDSER